MLYNFKYIVKHNKLDNAKLYIVNIIINNFASNINNNYIRNIVMTKDSEIIFYTTGGKFKLDNIVGIIIYIKTNINIYLMLFAIHKKYKKYGYGTIMMNEFIESFKNTKLKKIITHPIYNIDKFYECVGFKFIDKPFLYKKLFKYEEYEKNIKLMCYLFNSY